MHLKIFNVSDGLMDLNILNKLMGVVHVIDLINSTYSTY